MSLYTESSLERNITTDIGINFSSMQVTFTIINKKTRKNVLNFVLHMFKVDYKHINPSRPNPGRREKN